MKQYYKFEYVIDCEEKQCDEMIYSFKSYSMFDASVKALVVALGYIDELESYYGRVLMVNIYDSKGFRKYSVKLN